jgi:hypothetical protein
VIASPAEAIVGLSLARRSFGRPGTRVLDVADPSLQGSSGALLGLLGNPAKDRLGVRENGPARELERRQLAVSGRRGKLVTRALPQERERAAVPSDYLVVLNPLGMHLLLDTAARMNSGPPSSPSQTYSVGRSAISLAFAGISGAYPRWWHPMLPRTGPPLRTVAAAAWVRGFAGQRASAWLLALVSVTIRSSGLFEWSPAQPVRSLEELPRSSAGQLHGMGSHSAGRRGEQKPSREFPVGETMEQCRAFAKR